MIRVKDYTPKTEDTYYEKNLPVYAFDCGDASCCLR